MVWDHYCLYICESCIPYTVEAFCLPSAGHSSV